MKLLRDQVLIQIKLDSNDLDAYTLNELARQITAILEILLAFLFIVAEILLSTYKLLRAVVSVPGVVWTLPARILLDKLEFRVFFG